MHFVLLFIIYFPTLLHVSARPGHLQGVFTVKDQVLTQYVAYFYKILCPSHPVKFKSFKSYKMQSC